MGTLAGVSMRRVCRVLGFSRARLRARAVLAAVPPRLDAALAERIQQLIERHPTFGYRRLWALLRFAQGIRVNRKAVYRVLKLKGWLVHQRTACGDPLPWSCPICGITNEPGEKFCGVIRAVIMSRAMDKLRLSLSH